MLLLQATLTSRFPATGESPPKLAVKVLAVPLKFIPEVVPLNPTVIRFKEIGTLWQVGEGAALQTFPDTEASAPTAEGAVYTFAAPLVVLAD
jgi:hypothetical protein